VLTGSSRRRGNADPARFSRALNSLLPARGEKVGALHPDEGRD